MKNQGQLDTVETWGLYFVADVDAKAVVVDAEVDFILRSL